MISQATRYRLARKARLVFDPVRDQPMLLYPERGLALNPVAATIARMCSRGATVTEIVAALAEAHPQTSAEALQRDVTAFLDELAARGLLREAP